MSRAPHGDGYGPHQERAQARDGAVRVPQERQVVNSQHAARRASWGKRECVINRDIQGSLILERPMTVYKEVPEEHDTHGDQLADEPVEVQPFGRNVDDTEVDQQSDQRHDKKLRERNVVLLAVVLMAI